MDLNFGFSIFIQQVALGAALVLGLVLVTALLIPKRSFVIGSPRRRQAR
jgi:hypothetical protein